MLTEKSWRRPLRAAFMLPVFGVLLIFSSGSASADLIGHWTLDDGLSDPGSMIAVDSSGNGHDAELTDFFLDPLWLNEAQAVHGGGIDLGGEQGGIVVDLAGDMPIGADPRTITAWLNVLFPHQAQFIGAGNADQGRQLNLSVEENDEVGLSVFFRHAGGSIAFPGAVLEEWMHVAFVVPDGAEFTEDVQVYINGEETFGARNSGENRDLDTADSVFVIGGKYDLNPQRAFDASIDDVWLFDEALDQAAIQAIMDGGDAPATKLQAGDANMDLEFNQLDLVKVQIAAKYLTGQVATWGEGDWDGAPGGEPGNPPAGNGKFDQLDIIAALGAGKYLTGPYAAITAGGSADDGQTSIGYHAGTGQLWVDAPAGKNLTSVNIDSAAAIFTGEAAQNLGGSFDNDADNNIFKATFGSSFGSLSFGNVAQAGLSEDFVLGDLTVVGSLDGGGDLGNVDLIFVPEPSALALLLLGTMGFVVHGRRRASRLA